MKNINHPTPIRLLFNKCTSAAKSRPRNPGRRDDKNPNFYAQIICQQHYLIVKRLQSIIHHPRSLARPQSTWRPPTYTLPSIGNGSAELNATITRYRVGPSVREELSRLGENRNPAYLIYLRISNPQGLQVPGAVAEGWVRALHPGTAITAVHELSNSATKVYVWLVDHHFEPVHSPATLFTDFSAAA